LSKKTNDNPHKAMPEIKVPETPKPSKFDMGGSPERGRERLSQLQDQVGRRWGTTTAMTLDILPNAEVKRLPFGILMLDWRTGNTLTGKPGGVPIGRLTRIWGRKSTLKSTLCLRLLKQAQRHCRHCKTVIVIDPETGVRDCACPKPRFWLTDETDYVWLPAKAALELSTGRLPEGAEMKNMKGIGRVPVLKCPPPPHLATKGKGDKEKKVPPREIVFAETWRNEPWRCLFLDGEHTIDRPWAKANGVDTSLCLVIGNLWAEQSLHDIEESVLTREYDIIFIDPTSVLEPKGNLEKPVEDAPIVAARANLMGRFYRRHLSAAFEGLTSRYSPTVVCTSQVTTHGIGWGQHAYLAPTDGNVWEHGLSLDIAMKESGYTFDKATGQVALHGEFEFEVTKNKCGGSPGSTGRIRFWLHPDGEHAVGDSDDLNTVMTEARRLGALDVDKVDGYITEGSGKNALVLYSKFIKNRMVPFSKVGDCEKYLRENETVYDDLRARVLAKLMSDRAVLNVAAAAPAAAQ
jgi:RecA/RadA recombinase